MKPEQWLSLGLAADAQPVFEGGGLRTVEAAGERIVGIPRGDEGHHVLGEAASHEEASVIATILRLFNPG